MMDYKQGMVFTCHGYKLIIVRYKGRYYCGNPAMIGDVAHDNIKPAAYDSLAGMQKSLQDPDDEPARIHCYEPESPVAIGDIRVTADGRDFMLFRKKHGRLVWVSMKALQFHDLNEMLHWKLNYYDENSDMLENQKGVIE